MEPDEGREGPQHPHIDGQPGEADKIELAKTEDELLAPTGAAVGEGEEIVEREIGDDGRLDTDCRRYEVVQAARLGQQPRSPIFTSTPLAPTRQNRRNLDSSPLRLIRLAMCFR